MVDETWPHTLTRVCTAIIYPVVDPDLSIEAKRNDAYAVSIVTKKNEAYKPVSTATSGMTDEYDYI